MPDSRCKLAIVQTKPRKGQLDFNFAELEKTFVQLAAETPPDLIILPEAALTGYFLEGAVYDLAMPAEKFAGKLAGAWQSTKSKGSVDIVCGFYENDNGTYYNSAVYLHVTPNGHDIVHVHRKMFLPTYGVFDEERFLSRGRKLSVFDTRFGKMAMLVCEDVWHSIMPTIAAIKGARFLIVPSAAPGRGVEGDEELESVSVWRSLLSSAAAEHGVYLLYAGLTGFEGGKGFSGSSSVIDPRGKVLVAAPVLGTCIIRAELDVREIDLARASLPLLGDLASVLPDLLLDDELPVARGAIDAAGH
ncbi:MAG: beta-ureidopropionase [Candidatus Eremiobacteraeota bacterium]|nr:beta-ureidopropionase [Candidatus Eremiobacteraeota bacterium]